MATPSNSIGGKFVRTYTTFSGIDITAVFDDRTLLTVSGISCSVTREKAPIYTFGSASARSISRGKILPLKLAQNGGSYYINNTVTKLVA